MANNGSTIVPPNSTGNAIDCSSLSVGGVVAYRQRVVIADNAHSANFATVSSGSLQVLVENTVTVGGGVSLAAGTSKIGFLQKISASVTVQGNVGLVAGAAHIGEVNISLMPQVSVLNVAGTAHMGEVNISLMPAVVLAAGAANIGTINNISAGVVLAAGAANIGTINNISANVNVVLQAGANNIGTIQAISAPVVLAAGANNIGSINNISAAVALAAGAQHIGEVNVSIMPAIVVTSITNAINVSAMPTVNVNIAAQSAGLALRMGGRVKTSASSTVADATTNALWSDKNGRLIVQLNHPALPPSASHGPKVVIVSSSASVALLPAQGSGIQNYVDSLLVTNGSATLTQWIAYEASATATPIVGAYLAASGGGFVQKFDPPWRISANTILNMRIKPNASQVMVTIHFHVGVD